MPKTSVAVLKRKIVTIEQEGYLTDCWIARYTPGGTAKGGHGYYQLRSRVPFANGKKTLHITEDALHHYIKLVNNGRLLPKLRHQVVHLESQPYTALDRLTSSISDEWYTPPEHVALAREVMGDIDLDPASNDLAQQWIQARQYYTLAEDGLALRWTGRVWLNPPYGKQIRRWTEKAVAEYRSGFVSQLILLVRPAIASSWYQALTAAFVKCEPHQRIRFINRDGVPRKSPVHGNTFFYIGREVERFHSVFSRIGAISIPYAGFTSAGSAGLPTRIIR
jgi:DNA N-6-adenine-methyltransferase (Dam)